jgi:SAM-dependent methyltransferase
MKNFLIITLVTFMPVFINARECKGKNCCPKQNICNPVSKIATNKNNNMRMSNEIEKKEIIKQAYGTVAQEGGFVCQGGGCCGGGTELSQEMGYTQEELAMFADANLGLGCGHPVGLAHIKEGDVVLDLGSGAGLDCFLAARKVGKLGKVIGIDMTKEMIDKARENARKYNTINVEFRLGDIEALPIENDSIDVVISNCVINLASNKERVFQEAYRVLKRGGKMVVSDVVLIEKLSEAQRNDANLLCACVSGALMKQDYLRFLEQVGFAVNILDEDKEISKKWFDSDELPISSLKFIAYKK